MTESQTRQLPAHELVMSELMMPNTANFSGNVHGGELLRLLDQVAYSCASRYSGHYCVTLSVDKVLFKEPIHVGELVTFYASVNYTGRTSMEVGIRVEAQNIRTGQVRQIEFFHSKTVESKFLQNMPSEITGGLKNKPLQEVKPWNKHANFLLTNSSCPS